MTGIHQDPIILKNANCFHCGDECKNTNTNIGERSFCCIGCKTVFEILSRNSLGEYYSLEKNPGPKIELIKSKDHFAFLDDLEIKKQFLLFEDENISKVSFSVPQIHCSACIWLLENLGRLRKGVISSNVNFERKTADITIKTENISLRQLVELLTSIGYEPDLSFKNNEQKRTFDKKLIYKIGIAGFCFGNIMLMSLPEYFGIDDSFKEFQNLFAYASLALSIPVVLYSGSDYFKNALNGISQRFINIDVPIALGILTLFTRSVYEVVSTTGAGYFDSLAGLVFFLLIGKWFQQKTYAAMSFERDYRSYFPIAVNKIEGNGTIATKIEDLDIGDRLEIRNNELIPADAVMIEGNARIDYSFVTGESERKKRAPGDELFAGGRQVGTKLLIELTKKVNNSYLTQLWDQQAFKKKAKEKDLQNISNTVSKFFTIAVLCITIITAIYWWINDATVLWNAVTAVLIISCPCALALSIPFTFGNATRLMGRAGLYLKNSGAIEKMASISTLVFDKTGTITQNGNMKVNYSGELLSKNEKIGVKGLVDQSLHPLSNAIGDYFDEYPNTEIDSFKEVLGSGISGISGNVNIKLGSEQFTQYANGNTKNGTTKTYLSINNKSKGYFSFEQNYRKGLKSLIQKLSSKYDIHILSGDNTGQREILSRSFDLKKFSFDQSPMEKLIYINSLQDKGEHVMMIGDGLNDAGALKQSDIGLAITDKLHQFSPASDLILDAESFEKLNSFLRYSRTCVRIVYLSFAISFLYNIVGLYFATSGQLSPVIAAILMPLSSISIVVLASFLTRYFSRKF